MTQPIQRSASQEHLAAGAFPAEPGPGPREEPPAAVAARTEEVARQNFADLPVRVVGRVGCCGCHVHIEEHKGKHYGCTAFTSWSCSIITTLAIAIFLGMNCQYEFR